MLDGVKRDHARAVGKESAVAHEPSAEHDKVVLNVNPLRFLVVEAAFPYSMTRFRGYLKGSCCLLKRSGGSMIDSSDQMKRF